MTAGRTQERINTVRYIANRWWGKQRFALAGAAAALGARVTLVSGPVPLPTPRVLYAGPYDEATLRRITDNLDLSRQEGVVVRLAEAFPYAAFGDSVLKWVRPNHVQTDEHWAHQVIIPNRLRGAP